MSQTNTPPNDQQLSEFVYREALILDELRFDDWLDLFTEDGYYWMPLSPTQTDPLLHTSLLYEDKLLLKVRIERLHGKRTYSQQPQSRCHHLLQQPVVLERDDAQGRYQVRTAFHYVETRGDEQQLFAGWATHELVNTPDGLRIALKKVQLVNCDAAFGNIQLFM